MSATAWIADIIESAVYLELCPTDVSKKISDGVWCEYKSVEVGAVLVDPECRI